MMKDPVWDSLITHHNLEANHKRVGSDNTNYLIDIEASANEAIRDANAATSCATSPDSESRSSSETSNKDSDLGGNLIVPNSFMDNAYSSKNKKPYTKRLVRKSGGVCVKIVNVEDRGERYVGDFFTTLVDVKWRWTLTYFTISYVLSWFLFALIWWVIVRGHGDMDHFEEEGWKPCVVGVASFSSIFLFSLETQHTIGYGYHRMSDECMEAIILLVVQSIIGVIIESLTVGVFIVKLSRSKKRAQTVVFSKFAVICQKEKGLALMFRVADVGKVPQWRPCIFYVLN
ncbi:G protein-activated inward rectifier potassium channel 2 [Folsomia candida]|uniref:G protein-activated inward rectifier potassium channel 2 n=1 Tax=Folsomia candida TaxID=158441 RepID=A0A226EHB6_FOLCA|nr:G protein-activated inward rectifier potassium channel 2 [Folsomia candida]